MEEGAQIERSPSNNSHSRKQTPCCDKAILRDGSGQDKGTEVMGWRIGEPAHAAADAISHVADVRLLSLEAELVFLESMLLVDSVVDEIPGKAVIQGGLTCLGDMDSIAILSICT